MPSLLQECCRLGPQQHCTLVLSDESVGSLRFGLGQSFSLALEMQLLELFRIFDSHLAPSCPPQSSIIKYCQGRDGSTKLR
jgi:hypothetical protein